MEYYPRSPMESENRFTIEESCRDYVWRLRWPDASSCPRHEHRRPWPTGGRLFRRVECKHGALITAGTVFEGTRKPLRLRFRAIWYVTSRKHGATTLGPKRVLELGSCEHAWRRLHKPRRAPSLVGTSPGARFERMRCAQVARSQASPDEV